MAIEIDNDNNEIRIDGYEYAATKVSSKSYGISSESSQTGNSADLRLTGSDSSTDNVTFTGGTNVTVVRTDVNKITISASANDTNTTYGISAETNAAPKSADIRLTGSDSSTDNLTLAGGTNVNVTRTDANTITLSSSDTNTTYGISAETNVDPKSADIRLTGSDSTTDNLTLVGGTNLTVTRTDVNTITLSSADTNTTYGISAETNAIPKSADIRLTGSDSSTDNLTIVGGTNVTVTRTDVNTITLSSLDTNTTYGISAETSQTGNSADLRLTGSNSTTDNVTISGGSGINISATNQDKITISNGGVTQFNGASGNISYNSFGIISDGTNIATADQANDTITFIAGSGIGVLVNSPGDNLTISNTGVTQAVAGTGISVSSGTGNVTINNAGVTAITPGTGITTSGSGNVTVNNDGVTTFNGAKGAITYNNFTNITDGVNTATPDGTADTFTFTAGTGISAVINSAADTLTIGNTGVTSLNGGTGAQYQYATISDGATPTPTTTTSGPGHTTLAISGSNGIKSTVTTDTVTLSMTEASVVRGGDLTIGPGSTLGVMATGIIPTNKTIEISGVILFSFSVANPPATNTFDIILSTGSGSIGANTSKAVIGFTCHAGDNAFASLESSKADPTSVYPQTIPNTNIHAIRFSGIFQTDLTTPNSIIINMKNNCSSASENLIIYAKSFMKYNEI